MPRDKSIRTAFGEVKARGAESRARQAAADKHNRATQKANYYQAIHDMPEEARAREIDKLKAEVAGYKEGLKRLEASVPAGAKTSVDVVSNLAALKDALSTRERRLDDLRRVQSKIEEARHSSASKSSGAGARSAATQSQRLAEAEALNEERYSVLYKIAEGKLSRADRRAAEAYLESVEVKCNDRRDWGKRLKSLTDIKVDVERALGAAKAAERFVGAPAAGGGEKPRAERSEVARAYDASGLLKEGRQQYARAVQLCDRQAHADKHPSTGADFKSDAERKSRALDRDLLLELMQRYLEVQTTKARLLGANDTDGLRLEAQLRRQESAWSAQAQLVNSRILAGRANVNDLLREMEGRLLKHAPPLLKCSEISMTNRDHSSTKREEAQRERRRSMVGHLKGAEAGDDALAAGIAARADADRASLASVGSDGSLGAPRRRRGPALAGSLDPVRVSSGRSLAGSDRAVVSGGSMHSAGSYEMPAEAHHKKPPGKLERIAGGALAAVRAARSAASTERSSVSMSPSSSPDPLAGVPGVQRVDSSGSDVSSASSEQVGIVRFSGVAAGAVRRARSSGGDRPMRAAVRESVSRIQPTTPAPRSSVLPSLSSGGAGVKASFEAAKQVGNGIRTLQQRSPAVAPPGSQR